jgi:hypothetical protein
MNSSFTKYLKPSLICDFESVPEIAETAVALTSKLPTAQDKIDGLFRFVKNLTFRYDDWDTMASETLERRWGMCSGKVNLFVAMLRSLGIPSRYIVLRCRAETELYERIGKQNRDFASLFVSLPKEGDHTIAEVYINNWRVYDVARDPALERGLKKLGLPFDILPISNDGVNRLTLSSLDSWAQKRQKSIHIKEERLRLLNLMNAELERIRNCVIR